MKSFVQLLVCALVFLTLSVTTFAQERHGEINRATGLVFNDQLFVESVVLPSDTSADAIVHLHYRIKPVFLVFVKTQSLTLDSAYRASVQVTTEILDEKNVPLQSNTTERVIFTDEDRKNDQRLDDVIFTNTFELPPGNYRISARFSDVESQREREVTRPLHVKDFGRMNPIVSAFIPFAHVEKGAAFRTSFEALGIGGNILFAKKSLFGIEYQGDSSAQVSILLQKRYIEKEEGERNLFEPEIIMRRASSTFMHLSSDPVFHYRIEASRNKFNHVMIVTLPFDTLDYGRYGMSVCIEQSGRRDSLVQELQIIWKDMPRSLRNLRYAIEAMRIILTDDQHQDMLSGSPDEQYEKFRVFWKTKDPSPTTVWNEYLVEYFRRVDKASMLYQTIRKPDGIVTDRGRIHILYGAPERTERILELDKPPQEIWYYPSLKKKFIFTDISRTADYRLSEEGTL